MTTGNQEIKRKLSKEENPVQKLSDVTRALLDRTVWYKTIQIENRAEERKRFLKSIEKDERFRPEFRFRKYEQDWVLEILDECIEKTEEIEEKHLEEYSAEELSAEDIQEFFQETFREFKIFVKLAENIEDEGSWRKYSEKLWPIVDEETAEESRERLREIEKEELEKNVSPEEVLEMFREEVERLGMDYTVEMRDIPGCFNIPEEKTVVVAAGENGERMYSEREARMVTKHELFHAVRAYNGFQAGRKSGFPEILGLHSPYYDRAEEGGALYREEKTGVAYPNKEFDYHLRLLAAYKISQSEEYREEFQEIAEELIELGGSEERVFYLLARNREFLRHHIYQAGRNDWKNISDKEKMLIGKLNPEWAEKFSREIGGMIQQPEIGPEKLFSRD